MVSYKALNTTTKLMNASLFFPHLHSLFIVFFVGGLTLRNFGGAKLRITKGKDGFEVRWGLKPIV